LKFLIALDGSVESERALDYAIFLAKAAGASLGAIHVIEPPASWTGSIAWRIPTPASYDTVHDQHQTYRNMIELSEAKAKALLAAAEEKTKPAGLTLEKIMELGHPADRIVKCASERGYDLIVMGYRGNSGVKEMLLGSVSNHVCQHAKCPVLIVR
jgi:nucleotide-binding universal stress UspA family protein